MEGTAALSKNVKDQQSWRGFNRGSWCATIDVRDFINRNVTPYTGDEKFLAGPSKRTLAVWQKLQPYFKDEQKKGVLAVDAKTPSTLLAHKPGYIDRDNESLSDCKLISRSSAQSFHMAAFGWSRRA
jgi:formate C-acetyltransferase